MARRGKAWHGLARRGKAWQGLARQGTAWIGEAGQGKARHGKAWQGGARHGEARFNTKRQGGKMQIKAQIKVEGIKPILFHTFPIETLTSSKSKSGEDEWKTTVLMDEKRQLYVFGSYFQNSIIDGGKEIKVGRATLSKKISSTLIIDETKIYLEDRFVPEDDNLLKKDSEPVYLDVRSVVNPMTKGRNLRYRICASPGWRCQFTIGWDDIIASKEQMKRCVENGGSFQGVGDGRAIGFGRYKILNFSIL